MAPMAILQVILLASVGLYLDFSAIVTISSEALDVTVTHFPSYERQPCCPISGNNKKPAILRSSKPAHAGQNLIDE